jgi:hypothetical protein
MAQKPTVHEMLQLNELIRVESMEVQKVNAMLPLIGDADLRSELETCAQEGTTHLRALVDYCKSQGIAQ